MAYELAKQSLVEVNDKVLNEGDGTKDRAWIDMKPKARNLVLVAYNELHNPDDENVADFLNSRQAVVS